MVTAKGAFQFLDKTCNIKVDGKVSSGFTSDFETAYYGECQITGNQNTAGTFIIDIIDSNILEIIVHNTSGDLLFAYPGLDFGRGNLIF